MPPGYRLFQPYSEDSDDDSVPWWKGTPGFPGGSPLCEFFSLAHHTCKLGCTKVEEAVLIAAAIQGGIVGKGKTAGFVIQLLPGSLVQHLVPANAIKYGGGQIHI